MRFDFADAEVTGFAVDSTGNIFASGNGGRIQKIAAGSTSPTEFSTVGSTGYMNLAVGTDGDIFATNWKSNKVVRLDPSGRTVGEFDYPGGSTHAGVTVDPSGDVYVFEYMPVDGSNSMTPHLWEFAAGSTLPTEIPVKLDVSVSEYIAAGTSGNIYALPDNVISQGVIKLTGEGSPVSLTEPPNAGFDLKGMAVDRNGELYICNSVTGAVYRVNPWIGSQVRLPLSGLKDPIGVGVDGSGSVYVVQSDATVWKLPALK